MPRHWYAATVRPGQQDRARRELENQDFRVFNPRVRVSVPKRDGGTRYRIAPYLPGYVLVQMDLARQPWWRVNGTRGVGHLLMSSEGPSRIRRGMVEELLRIAGDGFVSDQRALDEKLLEVSRLSAGDVVEIAGMGERRYVVISSTHDRVRLMMEFMGREVETEAKIGVVRKVANVGSDNPVL